MTFTARVTGAGDRRTGVHVLDAGQTPPAACDTAGGACITHRIAAPPAPPASTAEPPAPAPTAPAPAPPVAVALGPAVVASLAGTRTPAALVTQRLGLPQAGRYTLILRDRVTGKRLRWLRGSRIGSRVLRRPVSAPVLATAAPDRRVVIRARVAAPASRIRAGRVQLRVILNRPGNPLADVVLRVASTRR